MQVTHVFVLAMQVRYGYYCIPSNEGCLIGCRAHDQVRSLYGVFCCCFSPVTWSGTLAYMTKAQRDILAFLPLPANLGLHHQKNDDDTVAALAARISASGQGRYWQCRTWNCQEARHDDTGSNLTVFFVYLWLSSLLLLRSFWVRSMVLITGRCSTIHRKVVGRHDDQEL